MSSFYSSKKCLFSRIIIPNDGVQRFKFDLPYVNFDDRELRLAIF